MAVPGHPGFAEVSVGDEEACREHHLRHDIEVMVGYDVFELVPLSDRYRERHHHREARVNGPGHEERWEDRRMPQRHDGHGEIEGHHRVHGKDQRRRDAGQNQIHLFVPPPMDRRAAPAERQDPVHDSLPAFLGRIAEGSQVGDEPDVPEHHGDGEVGRHREHVPGQRAAELRPHARDVGERIEPVEEPRPAHVNEREDAGAHDREDRHGFGEPVDARSPLLVEQQEDGGDQRAGVADADPPHEVDDREAPGHRDVDAPDADAHVEQPADGHRQDLQHGEPGQEADPPAPRVLAVEDDRPPIASPMETRSCLFRTSGCISGSSGSPAGGANSGRSSAVATSSPLRHGGIGITDDRQVREPRAGVQFGQESVVSWLVLPRCHGTVRIVQIAEDDRT